MKKTLLIIVFIAFSTLGFSQEKSLEELSAAPNPFKMETNISFTAKNKEKVVFLVKNILGKTVHKEEITTKIGKNKIPFSKGNLQTGIYIYSIQTKEDLISKRFVIQ